MKFFAPLLAFAAAAFAQQNAINIPPGGLQVTAGVPLTITWSDPSSGTVTIKLQQGSAVTPDSGITLLTGVSAAGKTATFTIPADEVNSSQYNIEIVDDSNPSNYNFTPGFDIAGATCVGTCDGGSASSSTVTGSATSTGTATTTTVTDSSTTGSTESSAATSSSAASSSSSESSAATSSSSQSTSSSSSATGSASTSAPSNEAGAFKAQAGLVMAVVAAVAAF